MLHLQQFFQVLQENGLTINPAKCVFAVSSLKFLGHMVDEAGITPLPRHVAAVQDCPPPTDIKQLQRFLGLINFYRRFLPAVARILQPLTDLLKGSPKVLLWSGLWPNPLSSPPRPPWLPQFRFVTQLHMQSSL